MSAHAGGPRRPGRVPIALTMGDPAGIGLEIALKAWLERDTHKLSPFCFYANAAAVADRAHAFGLTVPIIEIKKPADAPAAFATALPVADQPHQHDGHCKQTGLYFIEHL